MSTTTDPNEFLMAGGSKSAKFETVGDTIRGEIVQAEVRQQTDPEGTPKTWSNGDPVMQLVITLQTEDREGDDDDGERRIYAKGGNYEAASGKGTSMLVAIREAIKKANATKLEVGGTLVVAHSGLGKKTQAAYSAPKLYVAKYEPPTTKPVNVDDLL
jgi:hypothetical protein